MASQTTDDISQREWSAVQELLHDLQAEEDREHLAFLYGQWRLSLKAFRRVEARRMTALEPTDTDLLFHKACVTDLISFGTLLQIAAHNHRNDELAGHGLCEKVIEALLGDLHNSFDEWHAQIPEERIAHLSEVIFNAAPELNLSASRV